jgi:O-antigen/teichoic acid export membrane protein
VTTPIDQSSTNASRPATLSWREVAWSASAFGALAVAGFALNVVISANYDASALGEFNVYLAALLIGGQVGAFGVPSAVLYHTPRARALGEPTGAVLRRAVLLTSQTALVCACVFGAGAFLVTRAFGASGGTTGAAAASLSVLLYSMNKTLGAHLNGLRRIRQFSIGASLRAVCLVGAVAVLAGLHAAPAELVWSTTSAESLVLAYHVLILSQELRRGKETPAHSVAPGELRAFGRRAVTGSVLVEVNTRVDVLVVAAIAGSVSAGRYSVASVMGEGLYQLAAVARFGVEPRISSIVATNESALTSFLRHVRRVNYTAMIPIGAFALAAYPAVSSFVFGDDIVQGTYVPFAILCVGTMLASGYVPMMWLAQQSGHPRAQSAMMLTMVGVNLAGSVALVPLIGIAGAAVGAVSSYLTLVVFVQVFHRRRTGIWL